MIKIFQALPLPHLVSSEERGEPGLEATHYACLDENNHGKSPILKWNILVVCAADGGFGVLYQCILKTCKRGKRACADITDRIECQYLQNRRNYSTVKLALRPRKSGLCSYRGGLLMCHFWD